MPGVTFLPKQTLPRPGVGVRTVNVGGPPLPTGPQGIVAAVVQASWGPINTPTVLNGVGDASVVFGSELAAPRGAVALRDAFLAGALQVVGVRAGTGGSKAAFSIQDAVPGNAVVATAKYLGVAGNLLKLTIRVKPSDATVKQLLVYSGTTQVEVWEFLGNGTTEGPNLIAAVAGGSKYLDLTQGASPGNVIPAITSQTLTGGVDPTASGSEYTAAVATLAPQNVVFNWLILDSESPSIQTSAQSAVDSMIAQGKRVLLVVGEPTGVAQATRFSDASAFNDLAVIYVANGFVDTAGVTVEGYRAAARVAGLLASTNYTASLTHAVVPSAASVVGGLTYDDVVKAVNAGAVVFTLNASSQVQVEYGVTTLVTTNAALDAGWKKIRRVRERFMLLDRCASALEQMVGTVNNDPEGRTLMMAQITRVIEQMTRDGALLAGATVGLDPSNPPTGDSVWFVVTVSDVDSAEKIYLTFNLSFAPLV